MFAAAIPIVVLSVWLLVGFGPLAVLMGDRPLAERVLLAPAVGLAFVAGLAFWINRIGFPIESFARALTAALIILSAIMYILERANKSGRAIKICLSQATEGKFYGILLFVVLAGVLLVDWPGITAGLDWLGYSNDDMGNFVLLAERVRHHGFFEPPSAADVLNGTDISTFTANQMWRPAAQIMLAFVGSLLGLADPPTFMPLMMALYGAMVAAVAAIIYSENRSVAVAIVAVVAMVFNPLNAFSAYSQLLGQAGGTTFAAAIFALCVTPWRYSGKQTFGVAVLATVVLFAMLIWYFEFIPIVFASVGFYFALNIRQSLSVYKRLFLAITATVLGVYFLSGSYWWVVVSAVRSQLDNGTLVHTADALVFPYFLIKSGLVSFWGLAPITDMAFALIPKWRVGLAMVFFIVAGASVLAALYERKMIGAVTAVMAGLALFLWWKGADFGLFKASLYIQPFLAALIGEYLTRLFMACRERGLDRIRITRASRFAAIATCGALVLFATLALKGQGTTLFRYGKIAADDPETPYFNQVPGSSREHLVTRLTALTRLDDGRHYIVDSYNPVLTKLIMYYTRGTSTRVISEYPFNIDGFASYVTKLNPAAATDFARANPVNFSFFWVSSKKGDTVRLQQWGQPPQWNDVLIATGSRNSVLNKLSSDRSYEHILSIHDVADVSNYVSFLPSKLSRPYFDYTNSDFNTEDVQGLPGHVALWPNESDYFFRDRTFAGAGRYILLNAINPSAAPRVLVELTSSFSPAMDFALPPSQVVSDSAFQLGAVGRGSARLYSPPITPTKLGALTVFGLDMGVDGRQNKQADGKIVLDTRWLTTYVRDISLISEVEYRALKPPHLIAHFPSDLANKALEYSGFYEDGWIAERAFLCLAPPPKGARFFVRGRLPSEPRASDISELVVLIDGVEKGRHLLQPGGFEFSFDLEPSPEPIRVDLIANAAFPLGSQDTRIASVLIRSIGWEIRESNMDDASGTEAIQ